MIGSVSNPFTRSLTAALRSRRVADYVVHWDALEALVLRVYRAAAPSAHDTREFAALQRWLRAQHPRHADALETHWRSALIGGAPAAADPFVFLFEHGDAAAFAGNWRAMQTLAGAREALNRMILEAR